MAQKERPNKNYMELLNESNKEVYKFWNVINNHMVGSRTLEDILVIVLNAKIVKSDDVYNLFKLTKSYPGSSITNCSGMPILTIKLL
mgnify:CR=1 FL=1